MATYYIQDTVLLRSRDKIIIDSSDPNHITIESESGLTRLVVWRGPI